MMCDNKDGNRATYYFVNGEEQERLCWPCMADTLQDLFESNNNLTIHGVLDGRGRVTVTVR